MPKYAHSFRPIPLLLTTMLAHVSTAIVFPTTPPLLSSSGTRVQFSSSSNARYYNSSVPLGAANTTGMFRTGPLVKTSLKNDGSHSLRSETTTYPLPTGQTGPSWSFSVSFNFSTSRVTGTANTLSAFSSATRSSWTEFQSETAPWSTGNSTQQPNGTNAFPIPFPLPPKPTATSTTSSHYTFPHSTHESVITPVLPTPTIATMGSTTWDWNEVTLTETMTPSDMSVDIITNSEWKHNFWLSTSDSHGNPTEIPVIKCACICTNTCDKDNNDDNDSNHFIFVLFWRIPRLPGVQFSFPRLPDFHFAPCIHTMLSSTITSTITSDAPSSTTTTTSTMQYSCTPYIKDESQCDCTPLNCPSDSATCANQIGVKGENGCNQDCSGCSLGVVPVSSFVAPATSTFASTSEAPTPSSPPPPRDPEECYHRPWGALIDTSEEDSQPVKSVIDQFCRDNALKIVGKDAPEDIYSRWDISGWGFPNDSHYGCAQTPRRFLNAKRGRFGNRIV
ncbi:hypothetical protein BDV96DRAFT_101691 [Lophiotrema nucula]|uniref:4Fe-4S ferredoxin-type domain-containing protein n=1 Tax=Lophiotrema nucula TaxID=690887 RepID=A0A6A5Z6E5_9PLEO|nr:hypothetical protein BDV96DRAFT_101691 [Lophiotrema nucula]